MAKRFTSTEIWDEDWYLEMPTEYKLFWYYMLASCNHAGLFKVNLRSFCSLNGVSITSQEALTFFNNGKERIRIVKDGIWLIEDFFVYQYGSTFNPNNRVHESIEKEYKKIDVNLTSIRGLKDLKYRVKDKDKDIDSVEGGLGETNPNPILLQPDNLGNSSINLQSAGGDFNSFWSSYSKDVAMYECQQEWWSMTQEERQLALIRAPLYVASLEDPKFHMNPLKWLHNKRWNDAIPNRKPKTTAPRGQSAAELIAARNVRPPSKP